MFIPSIDPSVFPGTLSTGTWSSSSYTYNSSYAFIVDFYCGYVGTGPKSGNTYRVRCVRSGP
ncbi:MAG: DUF1566 domain-containing protein [Myxococcota bacterium]|jgi:hypothetical protein|nr:DUF1566 domain-containing protein [Myxococcota bacterium]